MYTTMMPPTATPKNHPAPAPDWVETITPEALHYLGLTDTEKLCNPGLLENETRQDQAARQQAYIDIRDDQLSEIADRFLKGETR